MEVSARAQAIIACCILTVICIVCILMWSDVIDIGAYEVQKMQVGPNQVKDYKKLTNKGIFVAVVTILSGSFAIATGLWAGIILAN